MAIDCNVVTCMPVELFLGGIVVSIALAIFGFIRQPQIPAMLVFSGIFIFSLAIIPSGIIMGKIPITSTSSGSTVTYAFIDNVFEFTELPKTIFGLIGATVMLCGGIMVGRD